MKERNILSKKVILMFLMVVLISFSFVQSVSANGFGLSDFNASPIFPENQDKNVKGYFSLNVGSNSVGQKIQFQLDNTSNRVMEFDVDILNAYTSATGNIQYSAEANENSIITDDIYELRKYISGPTQVTLQPGESKILTLDLNIPQIKGTGLGGIAFKPTVKEKATEQGGVMITDEVRMVYGVVVNTPGAQQTPIKISEPYIEPMPSYYVMRLPIENESAILVEDAVINYSVEDESGKVIFEGDKLIKFAPKTKFHLDLPFDAGEIVKNGNYKLSGSLDYGEGSQATIVDFENEIKYKGKKEAIAESQANKETNVEVPQEVNTWTWKYTVSLLLLVLLVIGAVIGYKKYRDGQEYEYYDEDEDNYDE